MSSITQGLQIVNQEIHQALHLAQRAPDAVRLLAVSKTKPLSAVQQAYMAGQRLFGENYVQEGVDKIQQSRQQDWADEAIEWHFIGPLQSNKTRLVAEHFDWVQSLERLKIAERLNSQRPSHLAPLNVCLQVNISGESTKAGIPINQVLQLASQLESLTALNLRGVMSIPQKVDDIQQLNSSFQDMHEIFKQLQAKYASVDTLSMGMSADMSAAIANGSTMVRVGSAIFGARDYT